MVSMTLSKLDAILERGLDAAAIRHQAISSNLANVDTPGYKRREVDFAWEMEKALATEESGVKMVATHKSHLQDPSFSLSEIKIYEQSLISQRNDKNGVNIDSEMSYMAENSILYDAIVTQIVKRYQLMRTVIYEGRK